MVYGPRRPGRSRGRFVLLSETMFRESVIVIVAFLGLAAGVPAASQQTSATTPAGCLKEARDYAAKRLQEMMAATTPATPPANVDAMLALNPQRAPLIAQINQ